MSNTSSSTFIGDYPPPCSHHNNSNLYTKSTAFQEYIPEKVAVDIMLLRDILDALESGLNAAKEELEYHKYNVGHAYRKDGIYENAIGEEIRKTGLVIEKVKNLLK